MLNMGIDGVFVKCVQALYSDIKSLVKLNTKLSPSFNCEAGLREGEHLSPLLFSIFINDLDSYLEKKGSSGLTINYNNSGEILKIKYTNTMYSLLRKCYSLDLPIDSQIELFDQTVLPILTYGCELWGMENCDVLENSRLRYFRKILKINTKTPNYVVLGETGKFHIRSHIHIQ